MPLDSTIEEPIATTIWRDLKGIGLKLSFVLIPRSGSPRHLRQWDLWGPLFLCLALASILAANAASDQSALLFASVFVIVWIGSAIVTVNAKLLGSSISFFQCVCVIGYCIFPLILGAIFSIFVSSLLARFFCLLVCIFWSSAASMAFLSAVAKENRKGLVMYPVVLFFLATSWVILVLRN